MSRIDTSTAAAASASNSLTQAGAGFNDLEMDSFLELLITEMQNQDPMNPMDNAAMIEQIGQIREIGATNLLTESLSSLSSNQQLVTASGLIGRTISGLAENGEVSGVVDRVTVEIDESDRNSRTVKVHVGDRTIDIDNIRQINTTD